MHNRDYENSFEKPITDVNRIDFLERLMLDSTITLRESKFGRGWRLHETTSHKGYGTVREAIDAEIRREND